LAGIVCFCLLALAVVGGSGTSSAEAFTTCPNETIREEQHSTDLPECRAFEMVTPPDKNGSDIYLPLGFNDVVTSEDGEVLSWMSLVGLGDSEANGTSAITQYVTRRGDSGWSTHGITPLNNLVSHQVFRGTILREFSPDFSRAVLTGLDLGPTDDVPFAQNIYREDTSTRAVQTVSTPLASSFPAFLMQATSASASSDDLRHVAFDGPATLLPEAPPGFVPKVYDSEDGTLRLAGILPDGTPAAGGAWLAGGSILGASNRNAFRRDSISRDGSRIFFVSPTDESSPSQIYMREDHATTTLISRSEALSPIAEPQGVIFWVASANGEKVLFTSEDALNDLDPGGSGAGLYLYTDSPDPDGETNLTFLGRGEALGGEYAVKVVAESADFSRVYFVSAQVGVPGESGETALYLSDHGVTRFLSPVDENTQVRGNLSVPFWSYESPAGRLANASDSGRYLAFFSYDAVPSLGEEDAGEVPKLYLYDADADRLICVSCPSGTPPSSGAYPTADLSPVPNSVGISKWNSTRFLSSDGRRLLFSTADALLPNDANGLEDVYEYDTQTGALSLLSTGRGDQPAELVGIGASADDVFIATRARLSAWDRDGNTDIYDVRLGGGFPEPAIAPLSCQGDACQPPPTQFNDPTPASSSFSGAGNLPGRHAKSRTRCPKHRHRAPHRGRARCLKHAGIRRGGAK